MPGPAPLYHPVFPPDFLEQAEQLVRQRTIPYQLRQRATLVLLLHQQPLLSNPQAGAQVHLHPNSVRLWRRRWANGHLSLEDETGRGCKPHFSPSGRSRSQSHRL
jgi:Homeodomain-like domain